MAEEDVQQATDIKTENNNGLVAGTLERCQVYLGGFRSQENSMEDFINSLIFDGMDYRRHDIKIAVDKTCSWLINHTQYKEWRSKQNGMLCLMGNPGTGKSTLMKYVSDYAPKGGFFSTKVQHLSFFFHARGHELQKSLSGLCRSLLCQLFRQYPDLLKDNARSYQGKRTTLKPENYEWGDQELQSLLLDSLRSVLMKYHFILMVDALDECDNDQKVEFLEGVLSGCSRSPNKLSILFSCRPYPAIPYHGSKIHIDKENKEDVKRYICHRLGDEKDLPKLHDTILRGSEGNFQWAVFVIGQIQNAYTNGRSFAEIEKEISETPSGLTAVYDHTIQKLNLKSQEEKSRSLQLFKWVYFASRPLLLTELRLAVAIDINSQPTSLKRCVQPSSFDKDEEQMKKSIVSLSGGLAEVVNNGGRQMVQFIHQSVRDYLIDTGLQKLGDSSQPLTESGIGTIHHHLSEICIRYLVLIDNLPVKSGYPSASSWDIWTWHRDHGFSISEILLMWMQAWELYYDLSEAQDLIFIHGRELEREFPLAKYAIREWLFHARIAEEKGCSLEDLWDLLDGPQSSKILSQLGSLPDLNYNYFPEGSTLLHIGSKHKLESVFSNARMQHIGIDKIDKEDRRGRTPLSYAAEAGFKKGVKSLLENGANPDSNCLHGITPFEYAELRDEWEVFELIREARANVAIQRGVDRETNSGWGLDGFLSS
ncbi:hypothetical protein FQN49_001588 [Arthroderma sp. PD_2]|nr:hypothetical protein FQN49_001588 [Arthroderma sp. PD_2]